MSQDVACEVRAWAVRAENDCLEVIEITEQAATAIANACIVAGATLVPRSKWGVVGGALLGAGAMAAIWAVSTDN